MVDAADLVAASLERDSLTRRILSQEPGSSAPMTTAQWRRGFAWKNDKLYVFAPSSVLVMRLWPDMLAWRRTRTKPWAATRKWADQWLCSAPLEPGRLEGYHQLRHETGGPPAISHLVDGFCLQPNAPMAAFATIPARERLQASRFCDRRWQLLAMMARCSGATDLLEGNAGLGFALANSWVLKRPVPTQPLRAARALISRPQVDILRWLGFPASERVRRILRRVEPAALSGMALPLLQRALNKPRIQEALAHLPAITPDVMPFITHASAYAEFSHRFLREVLERAPTVNEFGRVNRQVDYLLWRNAQRMAGSLQLASPVRVNSLAQLRRWHDGLSELYNRRALEQLRKEHGRRVDFGPPPFLAAPGVEPICDSDALLQEGVAMRHCVASYQPQIEAGTYFVFRVTEPVRATLGLTLARGQWEVEQIRGPRNQRIATDHRMEVMARLMGATRSGLLPHWQS